MTRPNAYEIPSAAIALVLAAKRVHTWGGLVRIPKLGTVYAWCPGCRRLLDAVEYVTPSCAPVGGAPPDCRCARLDPDLRPCEPCHRTTTERRL